MDVLRFFDVEADRASDERVDVLVEGRGARVERIVSLGHATPDGEWYDQPRDEWVLLLSGAAVLEFDGGRRLELAAGDGLRLPAHLRHRVAWTDPERPSVWLAVHFDA
ncbi:MAG: cupin domain-containing protein [Planctomycetes bacterium]|nr:cupin domain-containing protein [Planctomycetota bacterium]